MNDQFRIKKILALVMITSLIYSLLILNGCHQAASADRGDLPYYSPDNAFMMLKAIGSLEEEYQRYQGAAIVKITGAPQYYEADIRLEPGSPEEKMYIQSGATSAEKIKYYTLEADVIKIINNRQLGEIDKITLKKNWIYAESDPVYQYYQVNPDQEYLLLLMYDQKKDVYYYSFRAAFYIKDDRVFATNDSDSINMYSGKKTREMSKILGSLKE